MKTIHKYKIDENTDSLRSYEGMKPLHADYQGGFLCLWAEVDTTAKDVNVPFRVIGTGFTLPSDNFTHFATVQNPPFVWHIYLNLIEAAQDRPPAAANQQLIEWYSGLQKGLVNSIGSAQSTASIDAEAQQRHGAGE